MSKKLLNADIWNDLGKKNGNDILNKNLKSPVGGGKSLHEWVIE